MRCATLLTRARIAVLPLLALALVIPSLSLAAQGWSVTAHGGVLGEYAYRPHTYSFGAAHERFGGTALARLSVERRLARGLALEGSAGYANYERPLILFRPADLGGFQARESDNLRVRIVPVELGLRYAPLRLAARGASPYVALAPALYMMRWREHLAAYRDLYGSTPAQTHAFTAVVPGFTAAAGVQLQIDRRLGFDIGSRYLYSADPGTRALGTDSGRFDGLRQWSLEGGVRWRL